MGKRILFAGESWTSHTVHVKGFDSFTTSLYEEGVKWIREAFLKYGHEFDYIPGQKVSEDFPFTMEELKKYDMIVISDIGANTFLLSAKTFTQSIKMPNRLELIREYVKEGGALLMIGGYLTFQGIEGKGQYHNTAVEECLPVLLQSTDDRKEIPQGAKPMITEPGHGILQNLPKKFPEVLGYNRFKAKDGALVVMTILEDPFLVVHNYGRGKSAAYASDCSPHWAPPEFVEWEYYSNFWNNLLLYLTADN